MGTLPEVFNDLHCVFCMAAMRWAHIGLFVELSPGLRTGDAVIHANYLPALDPGYLVIRGKILVRR